MVESGKTTLSSQFVQVPDTPTNWRRPSMSRSTELIKAPDPPPNSPKKSGSSPVKSITYLRHLLILPTKFHPDLSTPSVSQDFQFPPPTSPMSPDLVRIYNKTSETQFLLISNFVKTRLSVLKLEISQFFSFSELPPPPPKLLQRERI